jgi:hypothetical protein
MFGPRKYGPGGREFDPEFLDELLGKGNWKATYPEEKKETTSMTDDELTTHIAEMWVANGGDDVGWYFCADSIANKIETLVYAEDDEE